MMWAAQAMAASAVELVVDPEALARVQEEFRRRTRGFTYVSGMPPAIGPPVVAPPEGYPSGILEPR